MDPGISTLIRGGGGFCPSALSPTAAFVLQLEHQVSPSLVLSSYLNRLGGSVHSGTEKPRFQRACAVGRGGRYWNNLVLGARFVFLSWQGQNGLIEYSILPDQNLSPAFLIEDMREGKIITTGNLSGSGEMRLTVMARDKGSPPLSDTAVVTLTVLDNRPFVPQFNTSEIR